MQKNRVLLLILDGFGLAADSEYNAISLAKKPFYNFLVSNMQTSEILASGLSVGLPEDQIGNSEVGHLTIGAGRVIDQDIVQINKAIRNKSFFNRADLLNKITFLKQNKASLHLIGLLSDGGVHSHISHLEAILEMCAIQHFDKVYIHAILDGRDTLPRSAFAYIDRIEGKICETKIGRFASIIGRYYAMDRDARWDRTNKAYKLFTECVAEYKFKTAKDALEAAYARNENDEFVSPTLIGDFAKSHEIHKNDVIFFTNFRSDRMKQIVSLFAKDFYSEIGVTDSDMFGSAESTIKNIITMSNYGDEFIENYVVFKRDSIKNTLGACVSNAGLKQLRIAETEKYAHVTYFFNGGVDVTYHQEDRVLIPSPKVDFYDKTPNMSAFKVAQEVINRISKYDYSLIVCNFANADMLGHTGNLNATIQSIEALDICLKNIYQAANKHGFDIIITADHGNAECMYDVSTNQAHTAHTTNLVPIIYCGDKKLISRGIESYTLANIAPSILNLLGIEKPIEMSGNAIIC